MGSGTTSQVITRRRRARSPRTRRQEREAQVTARERRRRDRARCRRRGTRARARRDRQARRDRPEDGPRRAPELAPPDLEPAAPPDLRGRAAVSRGAGHRSPGWSASGVAGASPACGSPAARPRRRAVELLVGRPEPTEMRRASSAGTSAMIANARALELVGAAVRRPARDPERDQRRHRGPRRQHGDAGDRREPVGRRPGGEPGRAFLGPRQADVHRQPAAARRARTRRPRAGGGRSGPSPAPEPVRAVPERAHPLGARAATPRPGTA